MNDSRATFPGTPEAGQKIADHRRVAAGLVVGAGWVSIGVTRSADGGRTWPPPVAQKGFEQDWLEYGNGRYAGLTLPGTPPRTHVAQPKGGWIMDGGYPSFVSPGCKEGHLGLSGSVFLLKGNPLGERQFVSRSFTIRPAAPVAQRPAALANGCGQSG